MGKHGHAKCDSIGPARIESAPSRWIHRHNATRHATQRFTPIRALMETMTTTKMQTSTPRTSSARFSETLQLGLDGDRSEKGHLVAARTAKRSVNSSSL